MRVMAGGAFHFWALASVIESDLIGVGMIIAVQIKERHISTQPRSGLIEINTRAESRGELNADRMIIPQVSLNGEYHEVGHG